MIKKNGNTLIYLAALGYAFIIGLSFLFTKFSLDVADPINILAHRFTVSFIVLGIPVLFKWVKVNYTKERIIKLIPLAIVYPMLFFGFQTFGLLYATSAEAGILLASAPVFTLILATYFLKEKSNILQKISIILSVTGVIYISLMKGSTLDINNIKGIVLLVLSALCMAGYNVMARKLTKEFTNIELCFAMIILSFVSFNLLSIGNHLANGTISNYFAAFTAPSFVISILYLGILSTLGTALLTNYILYKLEASKMSVFANLGTVISIVAGVVFLKEKIFYYHIIGSILIVGGVLGTNFLGDAKPIPENLD
ncbi:MAG: DMT family transporter [Clostridiales bacterium]|nr:DMT family transporter [Clostridiales bacterium]